MLELGLEETWPWTLKLGAGWKFLAVPPIPATAEPAPRAVPAVASQPPKVWGPELPGQQHGFSYPAPCLREKGCLESSD